MPINKDKVFLYFDRGIVFFLCLIIFCLPFSKAASESFTLAAFVLWVLKRVLGYRKKALWLWLPDTVLNKALGIFIAANALSVVFTVHYGLSLRGFFGKELKFLAIYFMLVEVINSSKRLKVFLSVIIASAVLMVLDAGTQYFKGVDFLRSYPLERLRASFFSASGFGGWLIVIIPLFFGLLMSKKFRHKISTIILLILTGLLLVCLSATYSRGAFVGFSAGIFFMAVCIYKKLSLKMKILWLSICAVLMVMFLFLPRPLQNKIKDNISFKFKFSQKFDERVKSIFRLDVYSNTERIMFWKEALNITRDYPLVGCGLNTYATVARQYKSFEGGGIYPHNSFLQMSAETGLLGLGSFLWLLIVFFRNGLKTFNLKKDYLTLGLLSGILAFLVHAFFDTHLYSLQLIVLFWYMLGLTVAVINLSSEKPAI